MDSASGGRGLRISCACRADEERRITAELGVRVDELVAPYGPVKEHAGPSAGTARTVHGDPGTTVVPRSYAAVVCGDERFQQMGSVWASEACLRSWAASLDDGGACLLYVRLIDLRRRFEADRVEVYGDCYRRLEQCDELGRELVESWVSPQSGFGGRRARPPSRPRSSHSPQAGPRSPCGGCGTAGRPRSTSPR